VRLSAALALVVLAACSRGPGPVHVVAVRAPDGVVTPALREAGIDSSALEDAAREALRAAGFQLAPGQRAYAAEVGVASVRLAPPNASGGSARLEVSVEIGLEPAEPGLGGAVRETGTGSADLSSAAPSSTSRTALARAAAHAAEALMLGFAEERKSVERLLADLESPDARVRDHAVRVLADRRATVAVPALIARLKDEEPRVAHRAVGALAQIGDRRAVAPLIDLSRVGDGVLAARLARIIGDLGGPEAEGYLLTIEAGHPDPRVRRAAREALDDLRARAANAAALSAQK
jgi:hypothetical protein